MLRSSLACHFAIYSHIVHILEGCTSVAPQLKYITDIILELKAKLVKIKIEVKEIKK